MRARAFITHKECELYSDCQDYFCINTTNKSVAVSDGISQSIFSAEWAKILSEHFANNGRCEEQDRIYLCDDWLRSVRKKIDEKKSKGDNVKRALRSLNDHLGAGATLCGVCFKDAYQWIGQVLGDSCIITISKENNQYQIDRILSSNEQFDNTPDYYYSFPEKTGRGTIKPFSGTIDNDHLLILVSDPFSKFLNDNKNDCTTYIDELLELKEHSDFCELVKRWRQKGMCDDDSTLCIVEWDDSETLTIEHKDDIEELKKEVLPIIASGKVDSVSNIEKALGDTSLIAKSKKVTKKITSTLSKFLQKRCQKNFVCRNHKSKRK